jgi:osmotically-inducible protein OsmY
MGRPAVVLLSLMFLSPACTPTSSSERAGIDQEIARNILWRFHGDSRFGDVRVLCEDRAITLEGRVDDQKAVADALQIARSESRGGKVESRLEIRPR